MNLKEAIEVQKHLIDSYSKGNEIFGNFKFINGEYSKYIDSCKIAIALMTNEIKREYRSDTLYKFDVAFYNQNPNNLDMKIFSEIIKQVKKIADYHNMDYLLVKKIALEIIDRFEKALQKAKDEE